MEIQTLRTGNGDHLGLVSLRFYRSIKSIIVCSMRLMRSLLSSQLVIILTVLSQCVQFRNLSTVS